jgi:hypothetical protein
VRVGIGCINSFAVCDTCLDLWYTCRRESDYFLAIVTFWILCELRKKADFDMTWKANTYNKNVSQQKISFLKRNFVFGCKKRSFQVVLIHLWTLTKYLLILCLLHSAYHGVVNTSLGKIRMDYAPPIWLTQGVSLHPCVTLD